MKRKGIILISFLVLAGLSTWYILSIPPKFAVDELHLNISDESYDRLSELRDEAMDKGFLERSPDDYVPADITFREENTSGKVRLKGDWTDHLGDEKWSFRFKLDYPMTDGLQVFSIQNPQTRGFLDGYVYHLLLKEEGILSNEFRFIELFVNEESWGIYCLEEHLTSRMISNQEKPEGIILKYDDSEFFKAEIDSTGSEGLIETADIKMYGDLLDKTEYSLKIERAEQILKDYQKQRDSVFNDFDADAMGKYYAICDLATAYHAMGWINIRFYYNFNTDKMEPIGYDAYPLLEWGKPYLGDKAMKANLDKFNTQMVVYAALFNEKIKKSYYDALNRIIQEKYVDDFLSRHQQSLLFLESEIQKEYSDYEYDFDFLKSRAKEIRNALGN